MTDNDCPQYVQKLYRVVVFISFRFQVFIHMAYIKDGRVIENRPFGLHVIFGFFATIINIIIALCVVV